MYALFEKGEFLKLIATIDAHDYQLEAKYMLYKVETEFLKFHLDNYKFAIINSKILAYIPDESIVVAKIGQLEKSVVSATVDWFHVEDEIKPTLWETIKSLFKGKK